MTRMATRTGWIVGAVGLLLSAAGAHADGHWKIGVNRTGLYRVTGAELAAAGLPLAKVNPRTIRAGCGGRPVALLVTGAADGRFDPGDALLFYGEGLDTEYTDTNVYWLAYGGPPGRRIASRTAAPPKGNGRAARAVSTTVRFEENRTYGKLFYAAQPEKVPHWFWRLVPAKQRQEFTITPPQPAANAAGRLVVSLFGNTLSFTANPDHHTRVFWNGRLLEDATWDGQVEHRITADLPAGAIRAGQNTLAIECPGDTAAGEVDQVFLDWVELTYPRQLTLTGSQLELRTPKGANRQATYAIAGLGPQPILLDVSQPLAPVRLTGVTRQQALTLLAPGAGRRILASREPYSPLWVRKDEPSGLRDPALGADYLVVAADALIPALQPLLEWRRQQGMRVYVAPVSEIYDEFGEGVFTPAAIRTFVRYASQRWQKPAPGFLLLVGDANYDYRDYRKTGVPNLVPSYLAPVSGNIPPATDWYFGCVDDDHQPELAVGRLPVRTPEETAAVVAKILRYEQGEPPAGPARALLVADHETNNTTVGLFERSIERLAEQCRQAQVEAEVLALRTVDPKLPNNERTRLVRQTFTPRVQRFLKEGGVLLVYHGHGGDRYWAGQKVLEARDLQKAPASALPPLCIDITCFTGWFDRPDTPGTHCLAESLLLSAQGGAIACISPSRMGGLDLARELVPYLLEHRETPIGVAFREARRVFITSRSWERWDPVETYVLLGDPALRLRWPAAAGNASQPGTQSE